MEAQLTTLAQHFAAPLASAGYGLLVWAASYAGWLPALGMVRPPWREPRSRTLQLVAAHLVGGMSLDRLMRWKGVGQRVAPAQPQPPEPASRQGEG